MDEKTRQKIANWLKEAKEAASKYPYVARKPLTKERIEARRKRKEIRDLRNCSNYMALRYIAREIIKQL